MTERKLRKNSKITRFLCIRCQTKSVKSRRDSKYCSNLCRVQESNDRKEAGFIHLVCKGTKSDVKEYFQRTISVFDIGRFSSTHFDIEEWLDNLAPTAIAKKMLDGILIYHYPQIKKAPFDVYLTDSMLSRLNSKKGIQISAPKIIGISKTSL